MPRRACISRTLKKTQISKEAVELRYPSFAVMSSGAYNYIQMHRNSQNFKNSIP